jgi:hypothetical protein
MRALPRAAHSSQLGHQGGPGFAPEYNLKSKNIKFARTGYFFCRNLCIFRTKRFAQGHRMADINEESGQRAAVANYVASMTADLSAMARRSGLDTIGYLLDMVRLEAESAARHSPRNANGGR